MRSVLTLLLVLAAAAPAQASFQINRSMGRVSLGMTAEEVEAELGKADDSSLGTDFVDWTYRSPAIRVTLKGEVITLYTRSREQRGPGGIGVGTSERRLRAAVGKARCSGSGSARMCVVGSFATGRRSTVFSIRRGRVRDITISVSTP
jgi:hypothetical protein